MFRVLREHPGVNVLRHNSLGSVHVVGLFDLRLHGNCLTRPNAVSGRGRIDADNVEIDDIDLVRYRPLWAADRAARVRAEATRKVAQSPVSCDIARRAKACPKPHAGWILLRKQARAGQRSQGRDPEETGCA
jgi:hypothetical protein